MPKNLDISVIVPLYNEEESVPELCNWISRVMKSHGFNYEVLLVDDGSSDNSWEEVEKVASDNYQFKGIRFNRNNGKSAALNTGFQHCTGDVVITMDADLQDSPDEIPGLYKKIVDEDFDIVSGWKKKRFDPITKTIPSRLYNRVSRWMSGTNLHDMNCGLKAYKLQVVKNINVYGEMHRYIPVIAKWQGFDKIGEQVVQHQKRKFGTTKFGLERFVYGFLDLMTITFVSRFRKRPMHFFGTVGSISFLFGLIFTVKIVWDKIDAVYISKVPVAREAVEQPMFFLALVALIIGVQLFLTGFLAELLTRQAASKSDYLIVDKIGL